MNQLIEPPLEIGITSPVARPLKRIQVRVLMALVTVAVLVAILHMAPYWHAQLQVPSGWTFTGNLNVSPDYMQYRIWARRTQVTGILVDNTFTTEPNIPYLPVVFYYLVGEIARITHISVEFVYAYAGMMLALGFTLLIFVTVRQFFKQQHQVWWIFLIILLGGGMAAHLKILTRFEIVKTNLLLRHTIAEPIWNGFTLDDLRGAYPVLSLFDTHFLVIWSVATAAVLALYFALHHFSWIRVALVAALYGATTVIHLYEGVTLLAITASVILLCWCKGVLRRTMIATAGVAIVAVVVPLLWQLSLFRGSGLPLPTWHEPNVLFAILFIGYPVAWVLLGWGMRDLWRVAGVTECFLLGWILGCTTLVLAGPFYPYPIRGTMTLQIPLYITAGLIYFSRCPRITIPVAVLAIVLLGATPVRTLQNQWEYSSFNPNWPAKFMHQEHREMVDLLRQRAAESDVLLVDKTDQDWETDDLWLAPEYPGKLYCGHFFLTVDYDGKRAAVRRFFQSTPEEQATFLREKQIRFLYVAAKQEPQRFAQVPGLVLIKAATIGSLFEYRVGVADAR